MPPKKLRPMERCTQCHFRWRQRGLSGLCTTCGDQHGLRHLPPLERDARAVAQLQARRQHALRQVERRIYRPRPNPEVVCEGQLFEVVFP